MWSGSLFNHYKSRSTSVQWHHKSEPPTHTRHAEFRTKNVSAIGQSLLAGESPLSQAIRTSPLELSLAPRWLVQMTLDTLLRCAPGPWVNQLQTELIIFPPEKKEKVPKGLGLSSLSYLFEGKMLLAVQSINQNLNLFMAVSSTPVTHSSLCPVDVSLVLTNSVSSSVGHHYPKPGEFQWHPCFYCGTCISPWCLWS